MKFQAVQASALNAMAIGFFRGVDSKGVDHAEYFEKGTTINSVRYTETLGRLKKIIKRIQPDTN